MGGEPNDDVASGTRAELAGEAGNSGTRDGRADDHLTSSRRDGVCRLVGWKYYGNRRAARVGQQISMLKIVGAQVDRKAVTVSECNKLPITTIVDDVVVGEGETTATEIGSNHTPESARADVLLI